MYPNVSDNEFSSKFFSALHERSTFTHCRTDTHLEALPLLLTAPHPTKTSGKRKPKGGKYFSHQISKQPNADHGISAWIIKSWSIDRFPNLKASTEYKVHQLYVQWFSKETVHFTQHFPSFSLEENKHPSKEFQVFVTFPFLYGGYSQQHLVYFWESLGAYFQPRPPVSNIGMTTMPEHI